MLKLVALDRTCSACPTQWEGDLDDGRMLYFRYRWGILCVTVSKNPTDDIMNAVGGEVILEHDFERGEYDGLLSEEDMMSACKDKIDFSSAPVLEPSSWFD